MRVDFEKWARRDWWFIEEGAALLLGAEPSAILGEPLKKSFGDICNTALRSIFAGKLLGERVRGQRGQPIRWRVSSGDFLAFAREKGYPIPQELKEAVNRFQPNPETRPKWPWGSHETELLRHLAAAADHFWKNYDPSNAPTNEEVTGWLMERGVSERPAQVIAQILRADDQPTGRRRSH